MAAPRGDTCCTPVQRQGQGQGLGGQQQQQQQRTPPALDTPSVKTGKVVRSKGGKWGPGLSAPNSYGVVLSVKDDKVQVQRHGQERKRPVQLDNLEVVPLHPSKQVQPVQSADMVGKEVVSMYGTESCKRGTITAVGAGQENPFQVTFKSPLRGSGSAS